MEIPTAIVVARSLISRFLIWEGANLAETTREHVVAAMAMPSSVDAIVTAMEALYADHANIGETGRNLVGALAGFASINGFHGLQNDDRGMRIARAMQRELGETPPAGASWPDASTDPAADPRFAKTGPKPAD